MKTGGEEDRRESRKEKGEKKSSGLRKKKGFPLLLPSSCFHLTLTLISSASPASSCSYFAGCLRCSSTQPFTVAYHNCEFCGLSTQWPSSGKYSIFDGTFCRCRVVNRSNPCETSSR